MIDTLTHSPVAHAIGLALVHFFWQGAALGVATAALLTALRRAQANTRYLVACFSLVAMTMTPILTAVAIVEQSPGARLGAEAVPLTVRPPTGSATANARIAATEPEAAPASTHWQARLEQQLPAITLAWGGVVLALTLRLFYSWTVIQRVRRDATKEVGDVLLTATRRLADRLGIQRRLRINESSHVDVPTVIGWLRPVILVPASALAQLSPAQLEAIIAHELAHIRRHDYLVNGLQNLVETLFFYHPAVWWLSARVRAEREHCCDDIAVGVCGNPVAYARALATLEESRQTLAFGLSATGGELLTRIQRLLGSSTTPSRRPALSLVVCAVVVISAAFVGGRGEGAPEHTAGPTLLKRTAPEPATPEQLKPISVARAEAPLTQTRAVVPSRSGEDHDAIFALESRQADVTTQLTVAETQLAALHTRLTPGHPDVIRLGQVVEQLRQKLEDLKDLRLTQQRTETNLQATAEAPIRSREEEFRRAKIANDTMALSSLLDDDYVAVNQVGLTLSKQGALDMYKGLTFQQLNVGIDGIQVKGDVTTVTGTQVESRSNGSDTMMFVHVWTRNASGVWRLRSNSQFRDPRIAERVGFVSMAPIVTTDGGPGAADRQARLESQLEDLRSAVSRLQEQMRTSGSPQSQMRLGDALDRAREELNGSPAALRVGGGIREPIKITDVRPAYPADALAARVQGLVILQIVVDQDGRVADARIVRSVPMLDAAALEAVRKWQYRPTLIDGRPTPVTMTVTVNFVLPQ